MPNLFSLIGNAWSFYREQPVLNSVMFWLVFLPLAAFDIIGAMDPAGWQVTPSKALSSLTGLELILIIVPVVLLVALLTWGEASILLVGKRLMESKTGRTRQSFRSVCKESKKFILPLILTGILQTCFAFFWALLLIIPGFIYLIQTAFFNVVIVSEGKFYRAALRKSKAVVRGQTWTAFIYLLGLGLILIMPFIFLDSLIEGSVSAVDARLLPIAYIMSSGVFAIANTLYLLSAIELFSALKKLSPSA